MLLNRKHNRVLRWRTACDTMSCHITATCTLFTVLLTDQSIVAADKMRCRHEQLIRQTIKTDYSQSPRTYADFSVGDSLVASPQNREGDYVILCRLGMSRVVVA